MNDALFEQIDRSCKILKLDFSSAAFAAISEENNFSEETVKAITFILETLQHKKEEETIHTLLRLSRLPLKEPKTFANFDFTAIRGRNAIKLKNLQTLSSIYAHKNIAFIGPPGTGKTHLAQAFGYECCLHGLKTYFIKMSELRDKFTTAYKFGRTAALINFLVRPSCLIIDEVGHCEFDRKNTQLFFDLVDRRYGKQGNYNIVFTGNKNPSEWRSNFAEDEALLCSLDRIFDMATVFNIRGNSFRGQNLETIALQTTKTITPMSEKLSQR